MRTFYVKRWKSIGHLLEFYEFELIKMRFAMAKRRFDISTANHGNHVLKFLCAFYRQESTDDLWLVD